MQTEFPKIIKLKVLGWDNFNPRKDVKKPTWFRLENNLFDCVDFAEMSGDEMLAVIYIFARACKAHKDGYAELKRKHLKKRSRLKPEALMSALEKLQDEDEPIVEIIEIDTYEPVQARTDPYASVRTSTLRTDLALTDGRTDETDGRTATTQNEISDALLSDIRLDCAQDIRGTEDLLRTMYGKEPPPNIRGKIPVMLIRCEFDGDRVREELESIYNNAKIRDGTATNPSAYLNKALIDHFQLESKEIF